MSHTQTTGLEDAIILLYSKQIAESLDRIACNIAYAPGLPEVSSYPLRKRIWWKIREWRYRAFPWALRRVDKFGDTEGDE
jgi:hypothetical protein